MPYNDRYPVSQGAVIGASSLHRLASQLGRAYHVDSVEDDGLLEGHFGVETLANGLKLRHAAIRNRHDMINRAEVAPGLKLILVLSGSAEIRFDGLRLPFSGAAPLALAINLEEAAAFERRARADTSERSLTLTLPNEWLANWPANDKSVAQLGHLNPIRWQPSPALTALAQVLLSDAGNGDGWCERLQREGLALTLAGEGLAALGAPPTPNRSERRHAHRLWEFIDSGGGDALTLGEIASRLGLSVSTLQRLSQERHGTSLQRHLRQRRLVAAERALRREGISVTTAAEIAGYSDPANFATAFRRAFGLTPRQAKGGSD